VVGVKFLLCGGRLKVEVVKVGDEEWEVFVFLRNGIYSVDRILKEEGFIELASGDGRERVMSKVVKGDVVDYLSLLSVEVAKEMRKWGG